MDLQKDLKQIFRGELSTDEDLLTKYSHDASLFELRPQIVASPLDSADIKAIVKYVLEHKKDQPELSLTARSAGTDMSGAAINDSIIVSMTDHFDRVEELTATSARVQPGVYFRDFDKKCAELKVMLPSYPASRDLCTIGGMTNNNSGGERSLEFGKTANFVEELKIVLADGNEYTMRALKKDELMKKIAQKDFEGNLYKQVFELLEKNYDLIKAAKPPVSKDSTGYHLWDAWDRETGIFDMTKIIVGAQGTLGLVTDVKFHLVPRKEFTGLLVGYLKNQDRLGEIINTVLKHKPATFESFDDNTLWLSFKFFPAFIKKLGFWPWVKLAIQLIPDGLALVKGLPKLILMVEFNGHSQEEVDAAIDKMKDDLEAYNFTYLEKDGTLEKSNKFWIMRRESFNLLRSKVKDKHTAPFIDDLIVPPPELPAFLPKLRRIIKKYKLLATVAGHMGDGNFHIIPLMKIEDPHERAKLQPAMKEVNNLVLAHHGSISGEHNDGLVRGPWLETMYGSDYFNVLKQTKQLFDPLNIFNPHKKTDANWDYSFAHIRQNFDQ
ncbi:MAG TPA: FAD-binding oxidoreductase [Candidatus Saccharimonadales bacterium]|nr:FAD-binding oxidoreductase [Candidatus Saccharimonadales bacterium]